MSRRASASVITAPGVYALSRRPARYSTTKHG